MLSGKGRVGQVLGGGAAANSDGYIATVVLAQRPIGRSNCVFQAVGQVCFPYKVPQSRRHCGGEL